MRIHPRAYARGLLRRRIKIEGSLSRDSQLVSGVLGAKRNLHCYLQESRDWGLLSYKTDQK